MNKTKLNNLKASLAANNFKKVITDQESALKLLSEKKWHNGFVCIRCNSTNYCRGKSSYSRINTFPPDTGTTFSFVVGTTTIP